MGEKEKKQLGSKDDEMKIDEVMRELDRIPNLKTLEEAEKLHKELSYMSTDDLLKPFTI